MIAETIWLLLVVANILYAWVVFRWLLEYLRENLKELTKKGDRS